MGVLVPVVFGFMALGLDVSYVQLSQTQARHVADAASHAAFVAWRASDSPGIALENAWAAAEYIVEENQVGFGRATLDNVYIGGWDPESRTFDRSRDYENAAQVLISRAGDNSVDLLIAPAIPGWGKREAQVYGESITAGRTREIMIVQDVTGSYADDMDSARAANLAFLDYMIENQYPDDMIGMTVFVGGVEDVPWDPIDFISGAEAEIYTRWVTLESCNCAPSAATWTDDDCVASYPWWESDSDPTIHSECWEWFCDIAYLNINEQPQMPDCHAVGAQTAPGPGIDQAVDQLVAVGNPTSFQAIIVNHDGLPCCGDVTAERTAATVAAVDRAWENGIHVWVVGFNEGGDDFRFLETLPRGQGTFYETPDPDELTDIMIEIAASIPVTLVQ
jgi:hypothetical protein